MYKIFKKIFIYIFFIFFIYIFFNVSIVYALDDTKTFFYENYNYDRYNYNYVKYIHLYYYDGYTINFYNFYENQWLIYKNSINSFNFFFYKYFFFLEDSFFNRNAKINYYLNNTFSFSSYLENYKYSLEFTYINNVYPTFANSFSSFIYGKENLNFIIYTKTSLFGDLFNLDGVYLQGGLTYFSIFLMFSYFFVLFTFFCFLFFFIIYYLFTYIFFYKKIYIMGQFLSMFSLDTEDNYGGYLDVMEEQEQDLSLGDTYYNIIRYEFNYLNYIVYSNKYLLYWVMNNVLHYDSFINLGQTKDVKFLFFSQLFTRIELNFLAGLTLEDDLGEWSYISYEHMVEAFPECNIYLSDAVYAYASVDLAYDFELKRRYILKTYIHPLSLLYDELDGDLEYEENFSDIDGFLKNYSSTSKILKTYKLRFKSIYKLLKKNLKSIENSVSYPGSYNTTTEIQDRVSSVGFEGFYIDWAFFREIINAYDVKNFDYEDLNEINLEFDDSDEKEKEKFFKLQEEDFFAVNKSKNYLIKSKPSVSVNLEEDLESNSLFIKKDVEYSHYIKITKDIWKLYSSSNFFSILLESTLLQWSFRSKWLWSKFRVPLEYEFPTEETSLLELDNRFSSIFDNYYLNSNFSESIYKNNIFSNFIGNRLVVSYNNLEKLNLILKYPPYKSYLGFLLINPFLRKNRDLYMNNFIISPNLRKLITKESQVIEAFSILVSNTYISDFSGLPSGMVLSTNNLVEEDLYSNSYLKENEQLELLEEEDVDNVHVKNTIYSIIRFIGFTYLMPIFSSSLYIYIIYQNI